MSSSVPPRFAITPIEQTRQAYTETRLDDVVARYRAFNDGLAKRLADQPDPPKQEPIKTPYFIECSVCSKRGPAGETIFSGTMAAQRAGFTYDSATLKAGTKVRWFCPEHGVTS